MAGTWTVWVSLAVGVGRWAELAWKDAAERLRAEGRRAWCLGLFAGCRRNGDGGHARDPLERVGLDLYFRLDVYELVHYKFDTVLFQLPYFGIDGPERCAWAASFFGACRRGGRRTREEIVRGGAEQ